jgi:hypothetical protein
LSLSGVFETRTRAPEGAALGCLLAVGTWIFPVPVAVVGWLIGFDGLFADLMYMAIPFLAALPLVGAAIGLSFRHRGGVKD